MIDYTLPLEELPDPLPIVPLEKPFDVTITPPGSKSITNRAYILAALAEGESRIIRPLRADDTDLLLQALCTLGAEARWVPGEGHDGEDVLIQGVGGRFPRGGEVNLGDGGTPTRFMIAAACLAKEPVVVDGSKRMRERPIAEGVDMLRRLGATIEHVEEEGRLPVRIVPSDKFRGGEIEIGKTQSSQFISALLLIAPFLEHGITLEFDHVPTSETYLDLTLETLINWHDDAFEYIEDVVPERKRVESFDLPGSVFTVEADASSALYWIVGAELTASHVRVPHLGWSSQQPDLGIPQQVLMVGQFTKELVSWPMEAPRFDELLGWECSRFPDGAIALAVVLATGRSSSHITGLHTLRVKETDRIAALANELRKVGCKVETTDDSITIHPIQDLDKRAAAEGPLPHGRSSEGGRGSSEGERDRSETCPTDPILINTYNDHRMAMAFAILGLRVPGLMIENPACVSKSYPTFWKDFAKLYG